MNPQAEEKTGVATKHTPLPWSFDDYAEIIWGPDHQHIADMRGWGANLPIPTNAALIVEAVNSHAHLLEVNRRLLEALKDAQEELRLLRMKDTGVVYDVGLRARISAAIALAEKV